MTFQTLFEQVIGSELREEFLIYYENGERKVFSNIEYMKRTEYYYWTITKLLKKCDKNQWIGLKCRNFKDWLAIFFAILRCGHPVMLLDKNSTQIQLESYAANSNLGVIITDDVDSQCMNITMIRTKDIEKIGEIYEKQGEDKISWADKVAFVTSGTTSEAKMYVFTADALCKQNERLISFWKDVDEYKNKNHDVRFLQLLPLGHCFGFGTFLGYICFGYTPVLPENISVLEIIKTIKIENVWFCAMVPAIWKGLLTVIKVKCNGECNKVTFEKVLGKRFLCSICAGAKLDSILAEQILNTGISLFNGWGMTEIGMAVIGEITKNDTSNGFVGRALPWYDINIEKEDGNIVKEGIGELLVVSDVIYDSMIGTTGFIKRNGYYFHTGDIFCIQGHKCFFLGRKKSVIINDTGENVYPEEIEEEFAEVLAGVAQSCVFEMNNIAMMLIHDPKIRELEDIVVSRIEKKNRTLNINRKLAVIYISDSPISMTGKGEVSRFYVSNYVKKNKKLKKIILMKGIMSNANDD